MNVSKRLVSGILGAILALGGVSASSRRDKSQCSVLHPWSTQEIVGVGVGIGVIGTLSYFVGKSRGASGKNYQNAKDIGYSFGLENGIDTSEMDDFFYLVNPYVAEYFEISREKDGEIVVRLSGVRLSGHGRVIDYSVDGRYFCNCEARFERMGLELVMTKFVLDNKPDGKGCAPNPQLAKPGDVYEQSFKGKGIGFHANDCKDFPYEGGNLGDCHGVSSIDCVNLFYNLLLCFFQVSLEYNWRIRKTLDNNSGVALRKSFSRKLARIYAGNVVCVNDVKWVDGLVKELVETRSCLIKQLGLHSEEEKEFYLGQM